ncbi:MAG: preprotein translocase subunit SecG [Pirellulaceae bacterium]|nr:preprotein translocase subunit SecG [Pirellulaceae bacterium]
MQYLLGSMMFLTALFLILLVLIQRGRGGGLAGAFGGAGGQSAFGTKAGDMFTRITIGTAAVWIVIAALSVQLLNSPKLSVLGDGNSSTSLDRGADDTATDGLGTDGLGTDGLGTGGLGTESSGTGTDPGAVPSTEPDATTSEQPDGGAAATSSDVPAADDPTTTPPSTVPAPGQ